MGILSDYDRLAAIDVLDRVAPSHKWIEPFIAELATGYEQNGYSWLWDELTKLERQYEPNQV